VNIVGDGRRHASPAQAAMRGISGLDGPNALTIAGEKKIYQQLFRGANTRNRTGDILASK
jgi:hypothetical protein